MHVAVSQHNLSSQRNSVRAIVAACIGNTLEWYDFVLYGIFAVQIAHTFFPQQNEYTSLLAAFITFGVGFLARPVGAAIFGAYADKAGRGRALTLIVLFMATGTLGIAFCPAASRVGIAAPIILVIARLIQGASAGGEFGGATALLVESAPDSRRGFYSSFQQLSQGLALCLCGVMGLLVTSIFTKAQFNAWAWRIPFLLGAAIAPVGFHIRSKISEPELYAAQRNKAEQGRPLRTTFLEHWRQLLTGIGIVVLLTVGVYTLLYIPVFAYSVLKIPQSNAYMGMILTGLTPLACPLGGMLADRFSRKSVMLCATICIVACAYPGFRSLTQHPTVGRLLVLQIVLGIILSFYAGPMVALLGEIFPTVVRSTGVALAYSLAASIFGGFTPAIVSALAHSTGNKLAVAFWLTASAAISGLALLTVRDLSRERLA